MTDKPRTYTEEEYKRSVTKAIELAKTKKLSFTIEHGWGNYDLTPQLKIMVMGGIATKMEELSLKIARVIIDYAEENKENPNGP